MTSLYYVAAYSIDKDTDEVTGPKLYLKDTRPVPVNSTLFEFTRDGIEALAFEEQWKAAAAAKEIILSSDKFVAIEESYIGMGDMHEE